MNANDMRRRRFLVLMALAALLGFGARQLKEPSSWPGHEASAQGHVPNSPSTGAATSSPELAAAAPAAPAPTSSLPPPGSPVAAIFDQLKAAADAGDGVAACRLAVELLACESLQQFAAADAGGEALEDALSRQGNLEGANSVASFELRQLQSRRQCAGITEAQRALGARYLRQGAEAGVAEAMVRYADGQVFGNPGSVYGVLRHPEFDRWRRDAPVFLQRALREGDTSAAFVLMVANSDDNSLFAALVPDDAEAAQSFRSLLGHLRGGPAGPQTGLDPAALARANAQGLRMHLDHFQGRQVPAATSLTASLTPAWSRKDDPGQRAPCQ